MTADPEEDSSWRRRYLELEASLGRFKEQAAKIRESLAQKMRELESKLEAAESRAETAEQQLQLAESRLAALDCQPSQLEQRTQQLERDLQSRDSHLRLLEQELLAQKQLRQQDAQVVEEKALRIKEWVSAKLQELEQHNAELQAENEDLQKQVELLRQRLASLPAHAAKEIYRISIQESVGSRSRSPSLASEPPAIPQRPPACLLEALQQQQQQRQQPANKESSPETVEELVSEPESEESMGDMDHEQMYQEVDANHESIYEPKRSFPPQIKIERKIFHGAHLLDSLVSSSNGSEEMLDRSQISLTMSQQLQEEQEEEEEDGLLANGETGEGELVISEEIMPIIFSPQQRGSGGPLAHLLPDAPPTTPTTTTSAAAVCFDAETVAAVALLPRGAREGAGGSKQPRSDSDLPVPRPRLQSDVEVEVHRYAVSEPHDAGAAGRPAAQTPLSLHPPPTPGGSDKASSEKRSHHATATKRPKTSKKLHASDPSPVLEQFSSSQLYQDITVPVYATLKGKAAQIRTTPFMGDSSSDSSENEEEGPGKLPAPSSLATACLSPTGSDISTDREPSLPTPRGELGHSAASEGSCDYALPPDDASSKSDSDASEPEQKLLKFAADSQKHDTLEKCGYLSKLTGKVKTWKRRFFVLRAGELFYYKSQHDVLRKPQGSIVLDDHTRVVKSSGELTFEITTAKKTHYLTADSPSELERWVRILNRVLKRQATSSLLDQVDSKAVVKGHLVKVKNGITRRCWCVLLGNHFLYYKTRSDKTPIGQINLRDAKLEEIEDVCDSDDESDVATPSHYVLAIWPPCQSPTYLLVPTKQEKDSWLYHLTVATGGGSGNIGSDFEQLIAKLMEVNGDANSVLWKHPLLLCTKEPITKPLTTLPSEELRQQAVELFLSVFKFMNSVIESHQLEFHVSLAQSILRMCIQRPELQNELYCQLIKQTSRPTGQHKMANLLLCGKHSWFLCDGSPTSPTSSVMDLTDSKSNPQAHAILQGWQLMSLCVSLFLPKQSIMWLLKVHLHRNVDPRTDVGKYAIFCQRALERTVVKGQREAKPSRMEVMSMLLRHPYHHSQPNSIPVHLLNGSYQVVSFDGSTTVQELVQSLNKMIGVRDCSQSGFVLFTDDPSGQDIEHCLQSHLKICDVISKWEQAYLNSLPVAPQDQTRTVRLLYKNRVCFRSNLRSETEKEKQLLAFQTNEEIVHGRFPLNRDLALELASLMAQVKYGDMRGGEGGAGVGPGSPHPDLGLVLDKFYPHKYLPAGEEELRQLKARLGERWAALRGRTAQDCVRVYLAVTRKWQFCGAKVFQAKTKAGEDTWLAVQEDGVTVLDFQSMQPVVLYDFKSIITFGGWKDEFMMVVNQLVESAPHHYEHHTEKVLFCMSKPKILELTLLIATYINIKLLQPSPEGNNGEL